MPPRVLAPAGNNAFNTRRPRTIRERLSAAINLDLDLLNFAFVRLFVYLCVGITSSTYELESDSSAYIPLPRCLRYLVS